ncbi:MAG: type I restriction enzyme HsdR N-terminal domain-containing protein [Flavobacteriales bacterium]
MNPIVPLNLPQTNLQLSRANQDIYVLCLVRRKKIKLTPEEWVRQHFIAFLHEQHGFPLERMAVEKSIQYGGLTKRWDILVYDKDFQPSILVECKAPNIPIGLDTLYQALTYQKEMQGKFIALTNGQTHAYFEIRSDEQKLKEKSELPFNH